ncbi:MAG: 1-phosphofructokinase family hexose kinase [Actinomycetota bacterium]
MGPGDAVILTVTLNAALDRTLSVPNLQVGHRHRASSSLALPGGHGVNVARALKRLGEPVIATGLAGGRTGTVIVEELTREGILNDFVRIDEESRTSTAVADPTNTLVTEINEYGPFVREDELEVLFDKLQYLSKGADIVVFAGSLPQHVPDDIYAVAIQRLRRDGLHSALDATGPRLRAGLSAEPTIVSVNRREAEEILGYEFGDDADALAGAEELVDMGASVALVHDEGGCVAFFGNGRRRRAFLARLTPLEEVVSTVGSGDGFLAGFLSGWYAQMEPEQALRRAVAAGAANTQMLGACVFDLADVEAFLRQVEVTETTAVR